MAYSKAAKRAAKRRRGRMHPEEKKIRDELAASHEPAEDPRKVVMMARARLMFKDGTEDVLDAMLCEAAGRAISAGAKDRDEAQKLWAIFVRMDAADEAFHCRILGKPRFPSVSRLEMMPERFETRADDRPDLRTSEEKDRDAKNRWARWESILWRMGQYQAYTIRNVMRHTSADLMAHGKLTTTGQAFVAAMRVLRSEDES